MKVCMECGNEFDRCKEGCCPYCGSADIHEEHYLVRENQKLKDQWEVLKIWLSKQIDDDKTSGLGIRIGRVLEQMEELE